MIGKFAKKGLTPSQIGVLLRDSHGVAQVKSVTGSKILRILKGQGTSSGVTHRHTPAPACASGRQRWGGWMPPWLLLHNCCLFCACLFAWVPVSV